MKKTIKFGGKDREFEANLGTADLYQMLTGDNLFEQLSKYQHAKVNDPSSTRVIDIYKKLAYVMSTQAETSDIPTLRGKMDLDNYLAWTFQFEPDDFTPAFTKEIAAIWRSSNSTNSTSKNP